MWLFFSFEGFKPELFAVKVGLKIEEKILWRGAYLIFVAHATHGVGVEMLK